MASAPLVASLAPVVRVTGLRKSYRDRVAVGGVDLEITAGQISGLLGPDGAGKSSVLKAVAGVLRFEAGWVEVFGTRLDSEAAAERVKSRLGFLPQGLGLNLYADLSVDENIDFFADLREVEPREREERKQRLLDVTRLTAFRARPMKHLSGGMKQKLGLVCTLIHQPELVILDEPTTGVDPVSRRDFWNILGALRAERRLTVLVSTAYMDEATRFDRVAFMHGGRVLAAGEPEEIRARARGRAISVRAARQLEARDRLRATLPEVEAEGAWLRVLVPDATDAQDACARVTAALGDLPAEAVVPGELELEDVFVALTRRTTTAPALHLPVVPGGEAPGGLGIEAIGLTRDFGRFRAVDDVSFAVQPGEIFGLLGANGAGKTTVIKMLTGILPPTAGRGHVAGADMRRAGRAIKRRIGYVSQAFSLYQDLTASENIRLFAGIYGLDRRQARERVGWALDFSGLAGHERQPAGLLPLGLRQRLALACALVHRPRALFLDEPTSGVDPVGRRRFWDLLLELARRDGVAILLTTHYMAEAEHCDRLGLMFAGRLVADASPAALKADVEAEAGHLVEIAAEPTGPVLAGLAAAGFPDATLHGRRVHVMVRRPEADTVRIRRALVDAGVTVGDVQVRPLTMEDVFVYRVTTLERLAGARAGAA